MTEQSLMKESSTETRVVNDFSITVATVNGSGSQTSNLTILRSLFKMGIPVSSGNLFPSNIQGLPTWYTIRASKDGYTARTETHEIVIAMNVATFAEDLAKVSPGGAFYYADHLKLDIGRDDIAVYPVPAKDLAKKSGAPSQLRSYVGNMAYVGVLAHIIGIDMEKIKDALDFHFKGKEGPVNLNFGVIEEAAKWAKENLEKQDPFYVENMEGMTEDCIMATGNTAGALGSIYGGVQFCGWYPITPATSLPEAVKHYIPGLRDKPELDGKTYAIVQAEDELAAIGMCVGAGWAGLRSMTSTSGPGISLMTEFIGLAYYSEIPVVIWNIQRVGPSTGMPTRTSQGDLSQAYYIGHGDTEHIILLPSSVNECFEFGWKSFDIAERVQTPVFVLSDLDLGMNQGMTEAFNYPDKEMDRGKVLWEEDFEKMTERWGRYLDVDDDGIPYRSIPGNRNSKSAYFARGTGHDDYAAYTEKPDDWEKNMARLVLKFKTAQEYLPSPVIKQKEGAKIGMIAFGSTESAIAEAQDILESKNVPADFLTIKALPLTDSVKEFIESHDTVYVVELNRDGQMHQILTVEYPKLTEKMVSLTKHNGYSLSAEWVVSELLKKEQE